VADLVDAVAPVAIAGAAGALVALVAAYVLLPHGSYNLDELVYLNDAEAIRHGRLTYDASAYLPDFRPYLTGVAGDRIVFKYQPLWPAWLAVSQLLTGGHRLGLVVAGAAVAMAVWLLARELTGNRWLGTATAVAVASSPVFVAHSGTALAYLPTAGLAAAAVGAVLRGVRTGSRWWLAAAGAAFGALFFHRPFDAVVAGAPAAVWLVLRTGTQGQPDRRWRSLAVVAVSAAPFVVAWLLYNRVTTGAALTPAFSVDAPNDRFGFGRRASWEATGTTFGDGAVDYTAGGAVRTVAKFAAVTPLWVAGGAVSVALIGVAMVRGRRDARRWMLLATIVLVIAGYSLWWGTENFVDFGLHRALGPAYWLTGLGSAAALAAAGATDLLAALHDHRWRARVLAGGAAGFALMTVAGLAYFASYLDEVRDIRERQLSAVDAAPEGSLLLFPTGMADPFLRVLVPADLRGADRLHAVNLETADQPFRLHDRFPGRSLWAWLQDRPTGGALDPPSGFELTELPTLRSRELTVEGTVAPGAGGVTATWLRTLDGDGHEVDRLDLDPTEKLGPATVAAGRSAGRGPTVGSEPGWLAAGADVLHTDGRRETVEVRWMVRSRDGQLDVIGPGQGYRRYAFPDATAWLAEDVSARIHATIEGLPRLAPERTIEPLP